MISSLLSTFEITNRRVLFLSTHKAAVYHWQKGALGASYLFDANGEGLENFERYLQDSFNTPLYFLVDMYEEEYRIETIPHVSASDRNAILQRRRSRLFRDTPYFHAEVQGREEDGRRDDRVFLSAITNSDAIRPWIELLDKYKVPMTGINSLPIFTGSILESFPEPSNQMLIVSIQSISGLRQTYFHNKEFSVSRLVQLPRYGTESYAPTISEEVEKISRYLMSLRLVSTDMPLDVYFLLTGELLGELKRRYENSATVRYHLLDINDITEEHGLSRKINAPFSDQFFVNLFLKRPPSNSYASANERRYSTMRRIRFSMMAASLFLIMSSVVISGINFVDALTLRQSSLATQSKAKYYADRYEIARERLPKTPVEPEDLKVAVDAIDTLKDYKTSPIEMVKLISKSLGRFPSVVLNNVEWSSNVDPRYGLNVKDNASNISVLPPAVMEFEGNEINYYQIAVVDGHLSNFEGNFRKAIETINDFTESLRNQALVYDVTVLDLPLDVSSEASLQGNTRTVANKAEFSVRIVMGVRNEA